MTNVRFMPDIEIHLGDGMVTKADLTCGRWGRHRFLLASHPVLKGSQPSRSLTCSTRYARASRDSGGVYKTAVVGSQAIGDSHRSVRGGTRCGRRMVRRTIVE